MIQVGCMKVGWSSSWWWDAKWSLESFFNALFFLLFSCVVCKVHVCSSPSSWQAPPCMLYACVTSSSPYRCHLYIFYVCSVLVWQLFFFFHCDICSYAKIIHNRLTLDSMAGICPASMLLSHGTGITSNFCPYWHFRNENLVYHSYWKPRCKTQTLSHAYLYWGRGSA
jgi:hypothetical protein